MHSLSAWGLPTPVVALACIGNVDIQVLSCAGGRLYFIRRLQVCCYKPPLKGVEGLFREVHLLVQSCRNRPAEFARCPRCPPVACQRRWLPLPVLVMLIFKCFLMQVGDFYFFTVLANKPPLKGEGDQRSWWRGSAEIFYSCFRFHGRNPSVSLWLPVSLSGEPVA